MKLARVGATTQRDGEAEVRQGGGEFCQAAWSESMSFGGGGTAVATFADEVGEGEIVALSSVVTR